MPTSSRLDPRPRSDDHDSVVLQHIQAQLEELEAYLRADAGEWKHPFDDRALTHVLQSDVLEQYGKLSADVSVRIAQTRRKDDESEQDFELRKMRLVDDAHREIQSAVQNETVIAGVLKLLVAKNRGCGDHLALVHQPTCQAGKLLRRCAQAGRD